MTTQDTMAPKARALGRTAWSVRRAGKSAAVGRRRVKRCRRSAGDWDLDRKTVRRVNP